MWNPIMRTGKVRHVLSATGFVLISLMTSIMTMQAHADLKTTASFEVNGKVTEATCDLDFLDPDEGHPSPNIVLPLDALSIGKLQAGGIYGLKQRTLELSNCLGVVLDEKFTKTVRVTLTGEVTSPYLFRKNLAGKGNDAVQGVGFAVTGTNPNGEYMSWNTGLLIGNSGQLSTGKTAHAIHNGYDKDKPEHIPLWIGMSCGDASQCKKLNLTTAGSLTAVITFTLAYS
ncbi:hypothetical protein DYG65_18575 [Yersinia enterocolitica]|nr:hypothetical protein [Yersinia enterocolitica]